MMVLLDHSIHNKMIYGFIFRPRFHELMVCLAPLAAVKMQTPMETPQAILAMFMSFGSGFTAL